MSKITAVKAGKMIAVLSGKVLITTENFADIIAVQENPLNGIIDLENVNFVMKDDVVYKNEFIK
ncbi:hypothetical protein [Kaistella polysaccharea]|uniref:hypothetical protein n=1 Tax=Kaistella polysaccharea TaxID=2878534 RepID=UPI001CF12E81|nr:hypothetical protein [Kaistella polysaccharea]